MMTQFIKVKEYVYSRVLYLNVNSIAMIFAADNDQNKTLIVLSHKYDGVNNSIMVEGNMEDIYESITDCCREDQFE